MLDPDTNPDDYPCPELIREYLRAKESLERSREAKQDAEKIIKYQKARHRIVKKDIELAEERVKAYEFAIVISGLNEPVTK